MMRSGICQVLVALALLFGVAACTWNSIHPGDAVARRVYVGGKFGQINAATIAQTAAPYLGVPLMNVDIQGMANALKAMPWMAKVSIDRHWPNGVVIRVTEHKPLAYWDKRSVLTDDFDVITPKQPLTQAGLPRLSGPGGSGKRVYQRFRRMNQRLAANSDVHIVRLQLDARGSWRATLANGLVLRLGRQHLAARIQRFIEFALGDARTALADAGYVDLRYSDGFAVGGTRTAAAQENGNEQKA